MNYETEIERDVFVERADQVCCNYAKYLAKAGLTINNKENPIVQKYVEAIRLVNNSYKIETKEDVVVAEKQLDEIRRFYRELQ